MAQVIEACIASVCDGESLRRLLEQLGYDVSKPLQLDAAGLGVAGPAQHLVKDVRRVAVFVDAPGRLPVEVYYCQIASHTVLVRKALTAAFKEKPAAGQLLILTTSRFDQLDFVQVMKSVVGAGGGGGGTVAVDYKWFAVDRRRPTRVQMRAVNRLAVVGQSTFGQWMRIGDAFHLAQWAKEGFNNRNLFSDYFLEHRLRADASVWKEHQEAYRLIRQTLANAKPVFELPPEEQIQHYVLDVLHAMGLGSSAQPGKPTAADHLLYGAGAAPDARPAVALLAYRWGRPLDRKDDDAKADGAEDVPGIRVVKVLEEEKVPWAIVTNGRDWRLYSAEAHSRATNYYEIDLPEAMEQENNEAFNYFYLFFRAGAFAARPGEMCFLDRVRKGSEQFAKELGDKLRGRVFKEVFPYLSQGFVDHRKQELGESTKAGEAFLQETYDATLTLLYRLLFLLYAESLDLLPVNEPAYAKISLGQMKQEVAEAAGKLEDGTADKLKKRYGRSETGLYDRLAKLFAVIADGSTDHNVPVYNGGLFNGRPDKDDTSREAAASRFLTKYKVPDFCLARALDLLARGEDSKTHELVFVDYKSLGVRQLGSIYEGLLMYHVVVPKEDWEKGYQLESLRVALVPSNKERKKSGSYFTPQHIVKYIVAKTVGPLLDEKFAKLAPELRKAQRFYQDQKKYEEQMNLAPAMRTAEENAYDGYKDVVHELLDLKVLDLAMGSGHFLVETVDYITDRVLEFLAGFPWNPVQSYVDKRVRGPILDSMESQGIKVDEGRLTDVNLIKRLVMKRCVYGVDLNPMAVELAKVSVWLDSFTIGAPLSFMDHHFRCGNSLIGSSIAELEKLVRDEGLLWAVPMEPLQRATKNMETIADLCDVTLTEVHKSADTYHQVLAGVEGYRVLLDCITAEHFGVEGAASLALQGGDLDLEKWQATAKKLKGKDREWVAEAMRVSAERRFFHWDIDFPDVFFTTRRAAADRKFDAVLGNPPYDELSEDEVGEELPEKPYLNSAAIYEPAQGGRQNLFRYFILRSIHALKPSGRHGFIVPLALIADQFSRSLRVWMFRHTSFTCVEAFPQKDDPSRRVFEEAKLPTVLYVLRKDANRCAFRVRTNPAQYVDPKAKAFFCEPSQLEALDAEQMAIPQLADDEWTLLQKLMLPEAAIRLREIAKPASGEIVFNEQFRRYLTSEQTESIVLRGGNVQRYAIIAEPKQGEPVYLKAGEFLEGRREGSSAFDHLTGRVVYQECAAIDNYRRIIPSYLPSGNFCGHKICYFKGVQIDSMALLAVFGGAVHEWLINAVSVTNSLSAYQVGAMPFPKANAEELKELAKLAAQVKRHTEAAMSEMGLREGAERLLESKDMAEWTSVGCLDSLDYLGWDARYPQHTPDEVTVDDGRHFANGVAPHIGGEHGESQIPWDLIARVYPSYPLPAIYVETWEKAAWLEFCDFLRKNKTKIGNNKIRADLTGTAAVEHPTGPLRKLQEIFLKYHKEIRENRAKAAELDFLIDRIVFRLFSLTLEEQKLILSRVGPGRPLPTRKRRAKKAKEERPGLFA